MTVFDFFDGQELTRPQVSAADAERMVADLYGITGTATELGSNQDRNYRIDASGPDGDSYLLKIDNSVFSEAELGAQNAAMLFLRERGLRVPEPVAGLDGNTLQRWDAGDETLSVRLLSFVPGTPLASHDAFSPELVAAIGTLAANVVQALTDFEADGLDRSLQWDLRNAERVVDRLLSSVTDAGRREAVASATADAAERLGRVSANLRIQPIHGDITDDNLLGEDVYGEFLPTRVIDFGDLSHGWVVAELAVTLVSLLHHVPDVSAVLAAVAAFDEVVPLTDDELAALWPLVVLRGAVLVVSGEHQVGIEDDNEYAAERTDHEWEQFEAALGLGWDEAEDAIRATVGRPARAEVPVAEEPVAEEPVAEEPVTEDSVTEDSVTEDSVTEDPVAEDPVAEEPVTEVPVIEVPVTEVPASETLVAEPSETGTLFPALAADDLEILDFSVTSPALDGGRWLESDAEWEIAGEALARVSVAAAPYGQYRLTRSEPNSTAEPATLALGWELFVQAGTTVSSPVDSDVLAVTDDAVHLALDRAELRISGVSPDVAVGDRVALGDALGEAVDQRDGVGRVWVQRVDAGQTDVPVFATPSEAARWMAVASDPASVIGLEPVPNPFDADAEQDRRSRIFASAQERYYLRPPQIERGWKEFLVGADGRVYLDMVNNVASIGHSHPRQVEAVSRQLGLLNTNSRFLYRALADLSERLVELAPDPSLDTVLLVNSGTEAVDLALRLAQVFTGRRHIVALREAYHGWSMGADAVTTSAYDNPSALANRPDWVEVADIPNPYRGKHRGADSAPQYLADLREQLDAMADAGRDPAGFICEPVLGNAGGVLMPDDYLAGAYEEIRNRGGVTIADEVQVGYGRLGEHLWGVQQQGVVPDIITIAKAMGNGYPLGAVITRKEIAEALSREGNFFSSSGGSPVSCAAGLAVLDVIRDEELQRNATEVGAHLMARLQELADRHPVIGAIHGMGLYLGVELVRNQETLEPATLETEAVCERLLQLGVIMQATSERQNVLKIKPPLCLSRESADFFVDALDEVLTTAW